MMARVRLKHVTADQDRHGNVRYYFRKRGLKAKTRLPGLPGAEEFMRAYEALLAGNPLPAPKGQKPLLGKADATSLRWLFQQYLACPEFKVLDKKTRSSRNGVLQTISQLPISEGHSSKIGDVPFAELTSKNIRRIRDRKAEFPQAANSWLKSLKVVFKWAVAAEHCEHDPAKDVPKIKKFSVGHHAWSMQEIAQYEAAYPIGTMERLALALLLYTGQRVSDIILFGPQHISNDVLRFTQVKNRNRKPVTLALPVLPALMKIIAATPSGHLTFVVTTHGQPFSAEQFSRRFSAWCTAAGLSECTAHGLRKAGATFAAENGATAAQLKAIFGWAQLAQADVYTRSVDQERLAGDSMHLIRTADKS
jgi:integrase